MKFLTKELFVECFWGSSYQESEDKFLIGYVNNTGNKLKDVITGQIVTDMSFLPLAGLKSHNRLDGIGMALGYMTGLRACDASIRQHILAKYIDSMLKDEIVDTKQIKKIKSILNKEIVANHKKELKEEEICAKRQKELEEYSIKDSEKEF